MEPSTLIREVADCIDKLRKGREHVVNGTRLHKLLVDIEQSLVATHAGLETLFSPTTPVPDAGTGSYSLREAVLGCLRAPDATKLAPRDLIEQGMQTLLHDAGIPRELYDKHHG